MTIDWVEKEKEEKKRKESVADCIKAGLSPIESIWFVRLTEEKKALHKRGDKLSGDSLKKLKELSAKLKILKEQQKAGL